MKNAEISSLSYKMKEAEATGFKPGTFAFFVFLFLGKNESQKWFPSIIEGMRKMIYDLLVFNHLYHRLISFYNYEDSILSFL